MFLGRESVLAVKVRDIGLCPKMIWKLVGNIYQTPYVWWYLAGIASQHDHIKFKLGYCNQKERDPWITQATLI